MSPSSGSTWLLSRLPFEPLGGAGDCPSPTPENRLIGGIDGALTLQGLEAGVGQPQPDSSAGAGAPLNLSVLPRTP